MNKLDTPDLCARLETMKALCDRLEEIQDNQEEYRKLLDRIREEANGIQSLVCNVASAPRRSRPTPK